MNPIQAQQLIEFELREALRTSRKPGWLVRFEQLESRKTHKG